MHSRVGWKKIADRPADNLVRQGTAPAANPVAEPHDVSDYIAKMAAELASMAAWARLDTLAYLLDIVRAEAQSQDPRHRTR